MSRKRAVGEQGKIFKNREHFFTQGNISINAQFLLWRDWNK